MRVVIPGRNPIRGLVLAAAVFFAPPVLSAADYVVKPETVAETKAVFGQVESRTVVPARARIGGTLQSLSVEEGSEVEAGQVIALVVDDKLALQRAAAEAGVKAIASQLGNAQTELQRAEQLLSSAAAPQSRLDQARTQVQVLTNQMAAAQAELDVVEQQSREGEVLAPASGRVLRVPATRGAVILAGEEVATIAGGGYFLRLLLPERHAAEIVEGDTVAVGRRALSAAGAQSATATLGRLVKVYPEIEGGRVVADVEVEGLGDYFVGERTLVWVPVGNRELLAVPRSAVTTRHGIDYVTLATDAGPMEVAVILGETFADPSGERVEVLTGLRSGDRLVLP
jgi:RND family efflux transporter MFP subunit